MKRLHFRYSMELSFDSLVTNHRFTLKCKPVSNERQCIFDMEVCIDPKQFTSEYIDSFGNSCIYGSAVEQHDSFFVYVDGIAEVGYSPFEEVKCREKLGIFKYPSKLTMPGPGIRAYYDSLGLDRFDDEYAKACFIAERLHEDIAYTQGVTNTGTTAEEAINLRAGVCQDYSQIMIALCRMAGMPSRYVVGMMKGEGLSHAWVEVCIDNKWIAIDPTNNLVVDDEHIKISCGRDYQDCRINTGLFSGFAVQRQDIKVNVEEVK